MLRTIQRHKRRPLIGLLIAAGLTLGQAIPAQALNFGFEFSNFFGNTNGTVTGRILGLQDNTSNQAASNVIIDSIPGVFAPIGSIPSPGGFGNDVLGWAGAPINTFSVINGAITSFEVFNATGIGGQLFLFSNTLLGGIALFAEDQNLDGDLSEEDIFLDTDQINFHSLNQSTPNQGNSINSVQITITGFPNQPVPEPSTILLLGSGLAGIVAWRTRKRS